MSFITYNPDVTDGPNITGVYTDKRLIKNNAKYIMINNNELVLYRQNPNAYCVLAGVFTKREDSADLARITRLGLRKQTAKNKILETISVGDREYTPDIPFQINLSLALHVSSHDKTKKPVFWCKIDDTWVQREHTHQELLDVAAELLRRREEISASLYKL